MALFSNMGKYKDFGQLVIRVGLGVLFIYHGLPKMTGGPATWEKLGNAASVVGIHFLPVMWGFLCALIETLGGVLVILGLAFRPICLLLVINLIIAAIFTFRLSGDFSDATHALEDAIAFAGLFFIGPGSYSIDKS
jgi:putative oxidoreductase